MLQHGSGRGLNHVEVVIFMGFAKLNQFSGLFPSMGTWADHAVQWRGAAWHGMSAPLSSSNILRWCCCQRLCLMRPQLLFQSPVQELGMHIFKALNWSGQHLGFEFQGKCIWVKRRQNPETVGPLLRLVYVHHMKPVNKLGGYGPACTIQRSGPKVIWAITDIHNFTCMWNT